MVQVRTIFWDSDNTLTANGDLHWRKHEATAGRYGVIIPDSYRTRIYHNNGQQNWDWLHAEFGLDVPSHLYLQEIDEWYAAHIHEIAFRPGIEAALELFASAGCRQCVVSNGRRNSVLLALQAKNLVQKFEFILCKEDYEGRKPDPAPYLAARACMDGIAGVAIDPDTCLAIEDDPLGVTSARKAGLHVIHRRLREFDPASPDASVSVYGEDEFLAACKSYL